MFASSTRRLSDAGRGVATPASPRNATQALAPDLDARTRLIAQAAAHAAAGRYGRSLALTGQALTEMPDDPELLFARGSTLFDWGRFREARDAFLQAEAMGLEHVTLQLKLGWSYYYSGDLAHSERSMRRATVTEPGA